MPSVSETAPGIVINGWFAVVAPAGTPPEIVSRLNRLIGEFLGGEDIRKELNGFGLATEGAGTPEATAAYIRADQQQWRTLAQELEIQPQ